ncbi:MAG: hypothetical protein KGJ57_01415 [Sphingomonadales bacterium]|nr:hypothetical protein [Sphingomonadales bacterium]MDE2168066.1 hypothetical protein [Sphingomonadales bacterium]
MSKYERLTEYLAGLEVGQWDVTFHTLEGVLGFPLPDSARLYQAWWSNNPRAQSLAWLKAGWRTNGLDMAAEKISFVRSGERGAAAALRSEKRDGSEYLTIAEAKEGLALTLGIDPLQIEIIIKA